MNTQQSPLWRSADNALYSEMELIAKISSQEHGVYVFDVAASSLLQQLKQERSNIRIFPCAEIITLIVVLKLVLLSFLSSRFRFFLSLYAWLFIVLSLSQFRHYAVSCARSLESLQSAF